MYRLSLIFCHTNILQLLREKAQPPYPQPIMNNETIQTGGGGKILCFSLPKNKGQQEDFEYIGNDDDNDGVMA